MPLLYKPDNPFVKLDFSGSYFPLDELLDISWRNKTE